MGSHQNSSDDVFSFALGLLAGVAGGAVAALLFAPMRGTRLRVHLNISSNNCLSASKAKWSRIAPRANLSIARAFNSKTASNRSATTATRGVWRTPKSAKNSRLAPSDPDFRAQSRH